ncbi:hypothetical protein N0V90_000857 [Kalmusia sp. IMI 367209]|nr:hypothetical protein N0V90_000857 [Kalmusia sp. IMI 367209]
MARTRQDRQTPESHEHTQDPPSPDLPAFSAQEILTERWTAGVRQTASYLSVDLAMLGRVDMAARIQSLLHNRAYIPEGMYDGAKNYWPYEAAHIQVPDMDDAEALRKRQEEEVAWVEKRCFQNSPVYSDPEKYKHQREVEDSLKRIFDEGIDSFDGDQVVKTMTELSDMCAPGTFQGRAVRTRAIDYLMEKGKDEQAIKMLEQAIEAIQTYAYSLYDEIPKLRYAWRLLITGVLREKLDVDDKLLEERGEEAIRTIEKRLRDGPIDPLESKSLNELIDMIEANLWDEAYPAAAQNQQIEPKPPGRQLQIGPKNFLRKPPASDIEISAVEARLGIELPDDLKRFLRLTNGFAQHNYPSLLDVVNGTDALDWEPPLIPEYKLELLPGFDAYIHPDIEPVALARIVPLNNTSFESAERTYLIEPRYIDEARARLREYYEIRAEPWMKRILDMSVQNYFGGWEALERADWGIVRFAKYESYFEPGFRRYLEHLVVQSGRLQIE